VPRGEEVDVSAQAAAIGRLLRAGLLIGLLASPASAVDDGSQMDSRFRVNYLGYFRDADKIALFLAEQGGEKPWELVDASGAVVASEYRATTSPGTSPLATASSAST